jgi:hypothetical protein
MHDEFSKELLISIKFDSHMCEMDVIMLTFHFMNLSKKLFFSFFLQNVIKHLYLVRAVLRTELLLHRHSKIPQIAHVNASTYS